MQRKIKWKKCISAVMVAALAAGGIACGPKSQDTSVKEDKERTGDSVYKVTEENDNPELTMNIQPESSYWFPKQLLEWEAQEDKDLAYNVSTIPLQKRAEMDKLETVNETQNKDTKIMALSIMNSSTSGNAPHGLNNADANTFSYWQYVDTLVYWGGSSGEGLIVAPSPDVVDAGHKNGVKVVGTIFFPQTDHGGKLEWLNDFLKKDASGGFPIVDKLTEVAETYGFDGWFLNQESEGTQEEPLTAEHASLTQEFIQAFKAEAPELELVYYDSMTEEGKMDWQNALTDANASFMQNAEGKPVADSMFLNFWWTEDELAGQELLKASADKAQEKGIDPYEVYAGVDVQSDGYVTPIRWNLLEKSANSTYTSLGLYCPSWAYSNASDMEDFWNKENALWVNSKGDPSAEIQHSSDTQWRGVSHYAVERTAITKLPFITSFNTGNGYNYFKNGELISKLDWNNRSISDILPTYRYIIENEGNNNLTAGFDVGNAYYGGSSLKLRGNMEKGKNSTIRLYSADLEIPEDVIFQTTVKSSISTQLSAVVLLADGTEQVLEGDKKVKEEWTTVAFDTSGLGENKISGISYQMAAEEESKDFEFYFGNITIASKEDVAATTVSDIAVEEKEFDEDAVYAGVRLSWKADSPAQYYEVYRVNEDSTKSLLGVSNTTNFYVNTLPRTDDTNKSVFEVVPVSERLENGISGEVTMEWPDNSIPKAGFKADNTLVAPGEKISFTSLCSANTETVTWDFPGAETESAEGNEAFAVYSKEGVYDVSVTAENKSGKTEEKVVGHIVVNSKASGGVVLLSQGAQTEASSFVNENEAPQFAVDGDQTKKWCATGSAPHEITIDLGAVKTISAVDIFHAEAGGEGPDMNTKSYTIFVSQDGSDYQEAANITRNTSGTTHDTLAPVKGRYVRVVVNKPTQGSDSAVRIYEIEVYGLEEEIF